MGRWGYECLPQKERQRLCWERRIKQGGPMRETLTPWADIEKVKDFYRAARKLEGMEVDHIVPFKSETVCGLHCEANLQALHRRANTSKGNRHWPDMWTIAELDPLGIFA